MVKKIKVMVVLFFLITGFMLLILLLQPSITKMKVEFSINKFSFEVERNECDLHNERILKNEHKKPNKNFRTGSRNDYRSFFVLTVCFGR